MWREESNKVIEKGCYYRPPQREREREEGRMNKKIKSEREVKQEK